MDVLRRLVRLYAPFICTITAYIHGYKFLNGSLTDSFVYNCSINAGFSVIMILYVMATAKRMCIWYKLNLGCLLGICACSFIYKSYKRGCVLLCRNASVRHRNNFLSTHSYYLQTFQIGISTDIHQHKDYFKTILFYIG